MVSHKARHFQHFLNMCLTNRSPQAKHAETDPRHGTPTMAHFQPPEELRLLIILRQEIRGPPFAQGEVQPSEISIG